MPRKSETPASPVIAHALVERRFEQRVLQIRKQLVMLDADLAELYGVQTGALNQAVRRNASRFPLDFMFRLTKEEFGNLISHSVISSSGYGGRRTLPLVFTEQGVAMLSSVLKSERAVQVNIAIMRAFVRLRQVATAHGRLAEKVNQLERKMDANFRVVFTVIEKLSASSGSEPDKPKRRIGFQSDESTGARATSPSARRSAPPARSGPA